MQPPFNVAEAVGGLAAFRELVDDFYDRVADDPPLRAVNPDELEPGKTHLALFLAQYFGAGDVYSSVHGHPRLRMRHAPFTVTRDGARRWATHMAAAVRARDWPDDAVAAVLDYVATATPMMINTLDTPAGAGLPTVVERSPGPGAADADRPG